MPDSAKDLQSLEFQRDMHSELVEGGSISVSPASSLDINDNHHTPVTLAKIASTGVQRFASLAGLEIDRGRPFLFAPVFLGFGIILWFSAKSDPDPALYRVAFPVALLLAFILRHQSRFGALVAAAIALIAAGMGLAAFQTARLDTVILDTPVTTALEGRVLQREALSGSGWRYTVEVFSTRNPTLKRAPIRVTLVARSSHAPRGEGETISGRVRLSPPSGPAMPGLTDFAFDAYFKGIGAVGYFYGTPAPGSILAEGKSGYWQRVTNAITALRRIAGERIRAALPGDTGAFATAIVTGERRAMSGATASALRLSGLAHVIAISGLHMALAAGLFFVGFRLLLSLSQGIAHALPVKKIAAFCALIGVSAYFLLSGSAVSAQRAWIMMSVMLIAVLLDRPALSLRNVALSALVILIIAPSQVMGASFQMSFAATVALIAGYAVLKGRDRDEPLPSMIPGATVLNMTWRLFAGIGLTSLIGGVATTVFSIAHFQQVALWGLPANLAAMPFVTFLVMPAGLVAMLAMPFGLEALPLHVMGFGLDQVITIARMVASWNGNGGAGLLPFGVFPIFVSGFLLLTLLSTRLRVVGLALILVAMALAVLLPHKLPEMIIAETGDTVGVISGSTIATNRERPPNFIFSQWQRATALSHHLKPVFETAPPGLPAIDKKQKKTWNDAEAAEIKSLMEGMLSTASEQRFTCLATRWCLTILTSGLRVAVVNEAPDVKPACSIADIVITRTRQPVNVCRAGPHKDNGTILVDGTYLARNGSIALDTHEKSGNRFTLETSRDGANRPWNRHRFYDWRTNAFIDPAADTISTTVNDSGE